MKQGVYHDGKPEARNQLIETTDEAAIGIRSKLGQMQW
jgi:hypothetical protein